MDTARSQTLSRSQGFDPGTGGVRTANSASSLSLLTNTISKGVLLAFSFLYSCTSVGVKARQGGHLHQRPSCEQLDGL